MVHLLIPLSTQLTHILKLVFLSVKGKKNLRFIYLLYSIIHKVGRLVHRLIRDLINWSSSKHSLKQFIISFPERKPREMNQWLRLLLFQRTGVWFSATIIR